MLKLTVVFKESKLNIDEYDVSGGIAGWVVGLIGWGVFGAWWEGRQWARGKYKKKK